MTKKNIYELTIKVLGIISVYEVILFIRKLAEFLAFISMERDLENKKRESLYVIYCISEILIFLLIAYIMIFKTDKILKKNPDKNENELNVSFNKNDFFEVIIKTLGLIAIVWTIPEFIVEVKKYFDFELDGVTPNFIQKEALYFASIKIILGFILFKFSKWINAITNK